MGEWYEMSMLSTMRKTEGLQIDSEINSLGIYACRSQLINGEYEQLCDALN